MATIFGHLNLSDSDRVFNTTVGQRVVWDAVQQYLDSYNAELSKVLGVFVEETTEDFKRRYKLPGGGYLQRRRSDGTYANVKAVGQWDVALPLEDFGAAQGGNDVDMAYMTVKELDRHVQTITIQNINTIRFELLKRLFVNTNYSFADDLHGTLTVVPLANGDTVVYPPLPAADSEATDDHYLESGYAASGISDTNNPFIVIRKELEEHFGVQQGGSNIVVFINDAQTAKVEALTDFTEVGDRFVQPGVDAEIPVNIPANLPGRVIGRCSGCWVVEWNQIPAAWMVGIHMDAPKPILQRVDPADTGLGRGLQLLTRFEDVKFPFTNSYWRHRTGFGVGNRLNGVVMEFGTGGSYTIPSAFQ